MKRYCNFEIVQVPADLWKAIEFSTEMDYFYVENYFEKVRIKSGAKRFENILYSKAILDGLGR